MSDQPTFPRIVGCPCFGSEYAGACICGDIEKVMRAYGSPNFNPAPMTPEQRDWCFKELDDIEGHSRLDGGENPTDEMLSRCMLSAWQDYARDKGLR